MAGGTFYKINLETGEKTLLTPGAYDVAASYEVDLSSIYYSASPSNSTQRYLYQAPLNGSGSYRRLTPSSYSGVNTYDVSPNGKYAIHNHSSVMAAPSAHLISTLDHSIIKTFVDNQAYAKEMSKLALGTTQFFQVEIEPGVIIDGRMQLPFDFDSTKVHPVLFHVYGEPWGQVATDTWGNMWNRYMTQQGYIVIDMDNRGTAVPQG